MPEVLARTIIVVITGNYMTAFNLSTNLAPSPDDKSSGLSHKDREERLRQLRDRQQLEKQQKLEELKEHVRSHGSVVLCVS